MVHNLSNWLPGCCMWMLNCSAVARVFCVVADDNSVSKKLTANDSARFGLSLYF